MARTPFRVEVLTPEGEVFNDEVEMVSTKTTVGSIGLLANHQPLLAMLDPTELRLYKSETDVVRYAQGEGFLQVAGTHDLVLVDEAFAIEDLDAGEIRSRLERAEQELSSAEEGTEERRAAELDKRRYEAFLRISEGGYFSAPLGVGRRLRLEVPAEDQDLLLDIGEVAHNPPLQARSFQQARPGGVVVRSSPCQ